MKIEMVVPSLVAAGMETVVTQLVRLLRRRGYRVGVTCLERRGILGDALEAEGVRVDVVRTAGVRSILFPATLGDAFRRAAPDVVHSHSGTWLKAVRAARAAGVPRIVHTMHGHPDREQWHRSAVERWAGRHTTAIAAVSEPMRRYLVETVGIDAGRIRVLPNGIDTSVFRPGPQTGVIRARFGLDRDTVVIGHVARFAPVKNHALLVDAFAGLLREQPAAFLALVGDGPLRGEIAERVRALGIADRVGFFGASSDLPDVYRDFDVFALSSLTEQTSMSILEAMASGLPVVATAVGGTPDLLDDERTGLLVPADDANALARALASLLRDRHHARALGDGARRHVLAHYDQNLMLERYEDLYALPAPAAALAV